MARELLVKPLGLVTRPNIYGQYPVGGMLTAQNLVMRAPGLIESAPALVLGVSMGVANNILHELFALDGGHMLSVVKPVGAWVVYVDSTASTFYNLTSTATFSATGRISPIRARERVLLNTLNIGSLVTDSANPTPPAEFRHAGFTHGQILGFNPVTANAQALPPNALVGYAVVYRRKYADGYEVVSKPSPIVTFLNQNVATVNVELSIITGTAMGQKVGDYVELYRTDITPNITSVAADPGTTLKLIQSVQLTALPASITMVDDTRPGPLNVTSGTALYTNPAQKGLLGGHRVPEIAACQAVFKGYTFLGNINQRPQLKFSIPGGIIDTPNVAAFDTAAFRLSGIGLRGITCVVTNGSPTVTGVSATHMLGIAVGQRLITGPFPGSTTVQSFNAGAGTITFTANANAGAVFVSVADVIELMNGNNGIPLTNEITRPQQFLFRLMNNAPPVWEVTTSEIVPIQDDPAAGIRAITWIIEPARPNTANALTVRATNGQNYTPTLTEYSPGPASSIPYQNVKNLIKWSNDNQPEHFPAPNEDQVGSAELIAMESTRDALWLFCTDGLYRLSGNGGQWRVDTADTTLVLAAPRASCVLKEAVYAYTNQGLVRITDAGTENLSELIVGDLLPGAEYTETTSIIVERNEPDEEVVIRLSAAEVYVYSVREQSFVTVNHLDVTAMAYARYPASGLPALAFGQSPAGSAPSYSLWNASASFLAPTARFHPLFAQDPFASKQWIDGTFIFDVASIAKSLTPAWNGTTAPASLLKGGAQFFNESRAVFGVPRRVAIGQTLAPGFSFGALSTATKMYALSMRYRQLGEQNLHR